MEPCRPGSAGDLEVLLRIIQVCRYTAELLPTVVTPHLLAYHHLISLLTLIQLVCLLQSSDKPARMNGPAWAILLLFSLSLSPAVSASLSAFTTPRSTSWPITSLTGFLFLLIFKYLISSLNARHSSYWFELFLFPAFTLPVMFIGFSFIASFQLFKCWYFPVVAFLPFPPSCVGILLACCFLLELRQFARASNTVSVKISVQ